MFLKDRWLLLSKGVCLITCFQGKELISLKREAKLKGGFYVEPEAKLFFIIRIRGSVLFIFIFIFIFVLYAWICKYLASYLWHLIPLQYQSYAPNNKKNFAASAVKTGNLWTCVMCSVVISHD